jgi:hypothetical protein
MVSLQCPICADDMSLVSTTLLATNSHRALGLPCCGQMICQGCLYRHIQSIFEEGLHGQGRTQLKCPFGCAHELTDKVIRDTIDRAHGTQQWFWRNVGLLIFQIVRFFSIIDTTTYQYYSIWYYWSHSTLVKVDIARYEQWSLVVALRKQSTMHCPAPGCNYQWITNDLYRRHKQSHEKKGALLWYKPPKPDKSGHFDWVEPEYANIGVTGIFVEPDFTDGRRMVCAKCLSCFCGLCRRPWEFGNGRKQRFHRGTSCAKYARSMPYDNDYAFVAQLADTRCCPGCTLRTQRTEGCNHMTCPCGYEWCYVCESCWNPLHYQCVDQPRREQRSGICVVS